MKGNKFMNQKIVFIGTIEEYLEWDKKKTKNPDKYKSFEIIVDIDKLKKEREVKKMTTDNERFSAEEAKVEKYLQDHKGENLTYRQAVIACLDKTESYPEREKFTERELREKDEEEEEEKLEEYKKKQDKQLKRIEEYIEKHPGTDFRTAALAVPALTPEEEKSQELVRMHTLVSDIMHNLAIVGKAEVVKAEDRTLLSQASDIVGEVVKSLREALNKKDEPEEEE